MEYNSINNMDDSVGTFQNYDGKEDEERKIWVLQEDVGTAITVIKLLK